MRALELWRCVLARELAADGADLTTRQLAVLLTVYLRPPPHTVGTLAATLGVPKPAVSRALARLAAQGLIRRKPDDQDKRLIAVQRTVAGSVFLRASGERVAEELRRLFAPAAR